MAFSQYTNIPVAKVFEELESSLKGLSADQALERQHEYGFNEVRTRENGALSIIMRQFRSPFFYLLCAAGLISLLVGSNIDSIVILLFVMINVVIGFIQEFRAARTISMLKKLIVQKVNVLRENTWQRIEKKYVVPGDIIALESGDIIPAELRIIHSHGLTIDESTLTGESLSVAKESGALAKPAAQMYKASNMAFAGTLVVGGNARGVVVATGKNTSLGHVIEVAAAVHHGGAYEKNLLYFCRLILKIVLVTIALIFLLNLAIKGSTNLFEFSLFCVALVVSILPEALPAIVVLALSRGSLKMAKDNVVVKRLSSIEDLGNLEVLCSDKTGTLTQNKLSLERVVSFDKDKALLYALATSYSNEEMFHKRLSINSFDAALFSRASHGIQESLKKYTSVSLLSFDSFRMRESVVVKNPKGEHLLICKGAPESVVKACGKIDAVQKKEMKADIARHGLEGRRVLAIAYKKLSGEFEGHLSKKDEKGLTFLGYFVFEDPLKTTAQEAIGLAKKMGVTIKILTGDAPEVSGYVAKTTGLITDSKEVVTGEQLEAMTQDDFDNACRDFMVFARLSPEAKYRIIKSLQKNYEVGFLGEGINDAPALKIADVGIAVAEASGIAREAADIVLLKKDLRVIISGIKHGRVIFANINKYIKSTLTSNFGNFYSIAVISLFIPFLPMLPIQILLANLLSDFPLISIASDSVDLQELRKPKLYQLHNILPLIISLALVSTLFDFIFFTIFYHQSAGTLQTLWFILSILTEIFLIFIIRTKGVFWKAHRPGMWLSVSTLLAGIIALVLPFMWFSNNLFHFVRPSISNIFIVIFLVALYVVCSEMVKLIYFKYFKLEHTSSQ